MFGLYSKQTLIGSKFQDETLKVSLKNTMAFAPLYWSTFPFSKTGTRHMCKMKPGGTAQERAGWLSFCPHPIFCFTINRSANFYKELFQYISCSHSKIFPFFVFPHHSKSNHRVLLRPRKFQFLFALVVSKLLFIYLNQQGMSYWSVEENLLRFPTYPPCPQ